MSNHNHRYVVVDCQSSWLLLAGSTAGCRVSPTGYCRLWSAGGGLSRLANGVSNCFVGWFHDMKHAETVVECAEKQKVSTSEKQEGFIGGTIHKFKGVGSGSLHSLSFPVVWSINRTYNRHGRQGFRLIWLPIPNSKPRVKNKLRLSPVIGIGSLILDL